MGVLRETFRGFEFVEVGYICYSHTHLIAMESHCRQLDAVAYAKGFYKILNKLKHFWFLFCPSLIWCGITRMPSVPVTVRNNWLCFFQVFTIIPALLSCH